MSSTTVDDSVTIGGETLTKKDEFRVEERFSSIMPGIYVRIEMFYEYGDETYATLTYANGVGPEVDLHVEQIANAIGSKLKRDSYDPQMHD